MSNIHLNPRKAKPSWLKAPCSVCDKWEEDESVLDPNTKALWNNKNIPDSNRCKYHPLLCDPNDKGKCPYVDKIGQTIIGLYCDFCGKEFEILDPNDPRLEDAIKDPHRIDICSECKLKEDKDLNLKRFVTLLNQNQSIVKE